MFVLCHTDKLSQHFSFDIALILCLYKKVLVQNYYKVANHSVFSTAKVHTLNRSGHNFVFYALFLSLSGYLRQWKRLMNTF